MPLPSTSPLPFTVGHPELDEQHRHLLAVCRRAAECAALSSNDVERFQRILDELIGYTVEHFSDEEKIMRECGFPEYEAHRVEHDEYRNVLREFLIEAAGGRIDKDRLVYFLGDWWCHHIMESDQKYAPYLAAGRT